jgi:hypothetical protein
MSTFVQEYVAHTEGEMYHDDVEAPEAATCHSFFRSIHGLVEDRHVVVRTTTWHSYSHPEGNIVI